MAFSREQIKEHADNLEKRLKSIPLSPEGEALLDNLLSDKPIPMLSIQEDKYTDSIKFFNSSLIHPNDEIKRITRLVIAVRILSMTTGYRTAQRFYDIETSYVTMSQMNCFNSYQNPLFNKHRIDLNFRKDSRETDTAEWSSTAWKSFNTALKHSTLRELRWCNFPLFDKHPQMTDSEYEAFWMTIQQHPTLRDFAIELSPGNNDTLSTLNDHRWETFCKTLQHSTLQSFSISCEDHLDQLNDTRWKDLCMAIGNSMLIKFAFSHKRTVSADSNWHAARQEILCNSLQNNLTLRYAYNGYGDGSTVIPTELTAILERNANIYHALLAMDAILIELEEKHFPIEEKIKLIEKKRASILTK